MFFFPLFLFYARFLPKIVSQTKTSAARGEENFRFSRKTEGKIEVSEGGNEKRVEIEGEVNDLLRRRG